ncbi:hypothetical protein MKW94_007420, partial [Papaver nudicaule]|nr:hypothetical protein [Papaver nudicaule]
MDYCNVQNRATNTSISVVEKKLRALQYIEDITRKADEVQKQVLHEILSRSAHVEYLQRHGLIMPGVTYEDLQPDIIRIANGDTSPILCSLPISQFLTSSGTSGGERKLMPMIEEEFERRSLFYSLQMTIMDQYVPDLNKGKGMYFMFVKSEAKTPGGLVSHPALTSYYKSSHFKEGTFDPFNNYTSPNQTILCTDSYQSMYSQSQLLCGLYQNSQVLRVGAVFASAFLRAIRFLQKHWTDLCTDTNASVSSVDLCTDIRTGIINSKISDSSVKEAVIKLLKPNPGLADFIESECSRDSWEGIITRLWPNAKYVDVIIIGTMSQYISSLDFYSNGLPIVSTLHASSECYFGLNLEPLTMPSEVSYTLIPTMNKNLRNRRLCLRSILRLFAHFQFLYIFQLIHLIFQFIVARFQHWELLHDGKTSIPTSVFKDCCLMLEESLNNVYRQGHVSDKSIGPLEIKLVETETFDKLMDYSINRGAQIDQYKTPRCVKFAPLIELLNSRVLSKYF